MRRKRINIPALGLCILLLFCCTRRPLDRDYTGKALVTVILDWSKAQIDRDGATVLFFTEGATQPITCLTNSDTVTVELYPGNYSILAFNETFQDFDNISFKNTDEYDKVFAFTKEDGVRKSTDNIIRANPDIIASASLDNYTITAEMVKQTSQYQKQKETTKSSLISDDRTITLQLEKLTYNGTVKIYVKGLNDIGVSGAYIRGFAESVFLSSGKTSDNSSIQKVTFTETSLKDNSIKEGFLIGYFSCFGFKRGETVGSLTDYELDFRCILKDGNVFEQSFITNNNITIKNTDKGIEIEIHVASPDDPVIIPEISGDKGWDINVGKWDDEEIIPIDF